MTDRDLAFRTVNTITSAAVAAGWTILDPIGGPIGGSGFRVTLQRDEHLVTVRTMSINGRDESFAHFSEFRGDRADGCDRIVQRLTELAAV